jgi:CRP/FNR family cyclic AMP-dependent transcriptional regulator
MLTLEPILTNHPFFEGLDKHYLELLTGCASNERYNAGEFLFREGEEATKFFLVRQGRISVEVGVPGGAVLVYTHDEGEIVGWSWLFSPYRWHFSGRATELTRVIALDGVCLRGKCEQDAALGYEFLNRFAHNMMRSLDFTRLQLLDMYAVRKEPAK